ncbi:hypothetical protein BJ912DRAFT_950118 [Pholiota molesta]|nr:hypothetical protein BJ912DRAFT_950118 [Pholiota molesta]
MRHKNPYGFRSQYYSSFQFAQLIGMEYKSTKFQDMQRDLGKIRKKYLNINYCAIDQGPNLPLIESELKKRHPQVFGGEHGPKHLYFAVRVVMKCHSDARHRLKRNLKPRRSVQTNGARNNGPSVSSRSIRLAKMPTPSSREADLYVLMPARRNSRANISVSKDRPIKTAETNILNNDCNSEAFDLQSVDGASMATSSVISPALGQDHDEPSTQYTAETSGPSHIQPLPSPSRGQSHSVKLPSGEHPTAIIEAEIYTFLHTCKPPMLHYLGRFVDFGCVTSTQLRSVSEWRPAQRHNLLEKILTFGKLDAMPSEMDIAVLENQFETYFLEG